MKKGRKKTLTAAISAALAVMLVLFCAVSAVSSDGEVPEIGEYIIVGNDIRHSSVKNSSAGKAHKSPAAKSSPAYPSTYDLRDYGYVTAPENQNPNGNCWAFATSSSMESNTLVKGYDEEHYSKSHLTYFTYTPQTEGPRAADVWNNGGNYLDAVATLSNLEGIASEDDYPNLINNANPTFTENDRFNHGSGYLIESACILKDENAIKDWLMNNGAVLSSMFVPVSGALSTSKMSSTYNAFMLFGQAFDTNGNVVETTNHAITIIGWDDSVPASEFTKLWGYTPSRDGAWIIKNSWIGDYRDYMYLSYDNYNGTSVGYTVQPAGSINKNYTHAERACYSYYTSSFFEEGEVYTATGNERITDVGFLIDTDNGLTNVSVTVKIYKNLSSSYRSPASGTLYRTFTSNYTKDGYYNFKLPEEVEISAGEIFSVCISMQDSNGCNIYMPIEKASSQYTYNAKESYLKFSSGGSFMDLNGYCGNLFMRCYTRPASCTVHIWDSGAVQTAPSCTENGTGLYTCTVCGEQESYVIPATGHTAVTVPATAATCTQPGYSESTVCQVCEEILTPAVSIPATGHSYGETVKVGSSSVSNRIDYVRTCSACGYTDVVSVISKQKTITITELLNLIFERIFAPFRRHR
ncbi:MAG: hypothetical protein IKH65_03415 [Clostridia bacterium]|nr:hypothetical protein [Clostridia bacterium]